MFENREGKSVPQVSFRARNKDEWVDFDSKDLFSGKRVVAFSLPGAFTPTCSSAHVPRYNELADTFKKNGVDDILCLSVNDGFVMEAWQREQKAGNIKFIPDGNGAFTRAMGMLVNKTALGFGDRSWRYSMLVEDGIIRKMFIEPEVEGDPFEVSDADTMLRHICPDAAPTSHATVFTKVGCPHCTRAKKVLEQQGIAYEEIVLGDNVTTNTLRAVSGNATTPQVFIDGKLIGSADNLEAHFSNK